jgi:hypothetical protein
MSSKPAFNLRSHFSQPTPRGQESKGGDMSGSTGWQPQGSISKTLLPIPRLKVLAPKGEMLPLDNTMIALNLNLTLPPHHCGLLMPLN